MCVNGVSGARQGGQGGRWREHWLWIQEDLSSKHGSVTYWLLDLGANSLPNLIFLFSTTEPATVASSEGYSEAQMRRGLWEHFVRDEASPECSNLEFTSKPGMFQEGGDQSIGGP